MERSKERNLKKLFNRTITYIILFFSIFALCYSTKQIVNYVKIKSENTILEEKLKELKDKNENLETLNNKLKDKDYFSVYVKDKYQYSSSNNSIIPID